MSVVLDPGQIAEGFRTELRSVASGLERPLRLVGITSAESGPARIYADYTAKGSAAVGIDFDLRVVAPGLALEAIAAANADPAVTGVFLYYPMTDPEQDRWLRELVDPRKDLEGMHSYWSRALYENRRFLDDDRRRKAILPCTPLAIRKLIGCALAELPADDPRYRDDRGGIGSLAGLRACVFNRSDVVGRPLSAMLANDGAEVISFDIDGPLLFTPALAERNHHDIRGVEIDRATALAEADLVVSGVPTREFAQITPAEIAPGAVVVNFASVQNVAPEITETAGVFIPRVGPMTVTMALRNAVRLSGAVSAY